MYGLLLLKILPPDHWDAGANLALFLAFVGLLIVHHTMSALLDDKGAYLSRPFGYSGPLVSLGVGLGAVIAGAYWFIRWASI